MFALGYLLLISLGGYTLSFFIRLFLSYLRKETFFKEQKWWLLELINGGSVLLIAFFFGLALSLAFQTFDTYNLVLYAVAIFLTSLLLKPTDIVGIIIHERWKEKRYIASFILKGVLLLTLILETFAFNVRAYKDGTTPITYQMSDDAISLTSDLTLEENGTILFEYDDNAKTKVTNGNQHYFTVTPVSSEPKRISLSFSNPKSVGLEVYVFSYKNGSLVNETTYSVNPVKSSSCILNLSKEYDSLRISLSPVWGRFPYGEETLSDYCVYVSGITFNPEIPFDFAYLRFFILSVVYLTLFESFCYLDKKKRENELEKEAGNNDEFLKNKCKSSLLLEEKEPEINEEEMNYENKTDNSLRKESLLDIFKIEKEKQLIRLAQIPLIRRFQILVGIATLLGLLIAILVMLGNKTSYFSTYPLINDVERYDIYTQLFDAFHKGRISLDVTSSKLWDHAYFNGSCYSYYGPLPVIFVSFPLYWLTGYVPNALALEIIGYVLMSGGFLLLVLEIINIFIKEPNWKSVLFALIASLLLSLSLMNISFKSYYIGNDANNPCIEAIYHIPYNYGLANFDFFLWLSILGYKNEKKRPVYFALAGLFFVFMLFSRPNLILTIIIAAPFFIKPLIKKQFAIKKTLLSYGPMALVLIIGAVFICKYNYDRFESIFEFGQRYQLTVSDQSDLSLKAETFGPSLFHFFLNPFSFQSSFPYIVTTNPQITSVSSDYSYYLNGYTGVLFIPLFAFALVAFPFPLHLVEDKVWHAVGYLLWPLLIILAWMTYSYAGLCPRYMIEPYHIVALFALIPCLILMSRFKSSMHIILPIFIATVFISTFITWNLSRNTFDGLNIGDLNGYLYDLRRLFTIN